MRSRICGVIKELEAQGVVSETSAGQPANTDNRISIELVETRVRDGLELDGDEAFPHERPGL